MRNLPILFCAAMLALCSCGNKEDAITKDTQGPPRKKVSIAEIEQGIRSYILDKTGNTHPNQIELDRCASQPRLTVFPWGRNFI